MRSEAGRGGLEATHVSFKQLSVAIYTFVNPRGLQCEAWTGGLQGHCRTESA